MYLLASNCKSINDAGKGRLIYSIGSFVWIATAVIDEFSSWKVMMISFFGVAAFVGYIAKEISLPKADELDPIPYKQKKWSSIVLPVIVGLTLNLIIIAVMDRIFQ